MNIIIPMAGGGQRFVNAGYTAPKPMIEVCGRKIVDYVCDMFDRKNDVFTFIINSQHFESGFMGWDFKGMVDNYNLVVMEPHKLGPVHTVLAAEQYIGSDDPVIVAYCDNPVKWDYGEFKRYVSGGMDGCIISHTGFHPHTLSSTMFAYSKTDADNRVLEIKEKSCYTSNRFKEHASSGIYYFKHGYYIKKYFRQAIEKNVNYNGEFYVTLVYNLLIQDGLNVFSYLNDEVLAFGTPQEVRNYEAWQTIINGGQVNSVEDAIDCYNYWSRVKK